MEQIPNVKFLKCDFLEKETKVKILKYFGSKIDVIVSDMAANTTGIKDLDCIRTNQLCSDVILFSTHVLKQKGVIIAKLFMGEDFLAVKKLAKQKFEKIELNLNLAEANPKRFIYIVLH